MERILNLLEELPEGSQLIENQSNALKRLADNKGRPAPLRARIAELIGRIPSDPNGIELQVQDTDPEA